MAGEDMSSSPIRPASWQSDAEDVATPPTSPFNSSSRGQKEEALDSEDAKILLTLRYGNATEPMILPPTNPIQGAEEALLVHEAAKALLTLRDGSTIEPKVLPPPSPTRISAEDWETPQAADALLSLRHGITFKPTVLLPALDFSSFRAPKCSRVGQVPDSEPWDIDEHMFSRLPSSPRCLAPTIDRMIEQQQPSSTQVTSGSANSDQGVPELTQNPPLTSSPSLAHLQLAPFHGATFPTAAVLNDANLRHAVIQADTTHLSGGQIIAALREQGLVAVSGGSAASEHQNVTALAESIRRESAIPPSGSKWKAVAEQSAALRKKKVHFAPESGVEGRGEVEEAGKDAKLHKEEGEGVTASPEGDGDVEEKI